MYSQPIHPSYECIDILHTNHMIPTEILQQKVLACTEFWTCNLLTQISLALQLWLPFRIWTFSWLHTVGPIQVSSILGDHCKNQIFAWMAPWTSLKWFPSCGTYQSEQYGVDNSTPFIPFHLPLKILIFLAMSMKRKFTSSCELHLYLSAMILLPGGPCLLCPCDKLLHRPGLESRIHKSMSQ